MRGFEGLMTHRQVGVTSITEAWPPGHVLVVVAHHVDHAAIRGADEESSHAVEGFNFGWFANYRSPSGEATVELVTRDATAPHDSVIAVQVGSDVDDVYAEAKRRRY